MIDPDAVRRWLLAEPVRWRLVTLAGLYGLYAIYVAANYVLVPSGPDDPIYRLTGVPRTEQVLWCTIGVSVAALLVLLIHVVRRRAALDLGAAGRVRRWTVVVFVLLFLNAVTMSAGAVLGDIAARFWLPLYGWIGLVLAVEGLVVALVLARLKAPRIHVVLLFALSLFNLYSLDLALMESFQTLPLAIRIALMAIAALGLTVLFVALGTRAVRPGSAALVLALTAIAPLAALPATLSGPAPAERISAFQAIDLRATPNIHIVSMDALTPPVLVRKHLGLENVPYADVLAGDGAIRFRNAFASAVPTKWSLNSVMRLAHPAFPYDTGYFAGRVDGPLAAMLRANGYYVATGFENLYLGSKGPYVDAFKPSPSRSVQNSTLCTLADSSAITFFGFCHAGEVLARDDPEDDWPSRVLDIVERIARSPETRPAFTFHHLLDPIGHTGLNFRTSDRAARAKYGATYAGRAPRAAAIMRRLAGIARNDGVPSVVVVMGDHGTYVSRTAAFEDDPAFVVQDRHGIVLAVLVNETDCSPAALHHYASAYATPERVLAGLMRCLARDPSAVDKAMTFDEAFPFERFLYE